MNWGNDDGAQGAEGKSTLLTWMWETLIVAIGFVGPKGMDFDEVRRKAQAERREIVMRVRGNRGTTARMTRGDNLALVSATLRRALELTEQRQEQET